MISYENLHTSMLAYLNTKAEALGANLNVSISAVNFDAFASESDIPDGDVLGLESLAWMEDEGVYTFSCLFTCGTDDDVNNMRLVKIVSSVFNDVKPECKLRYFDEQLQAQVGWLVVTNGSSVLPVQRGSISKAFQSVSFRGALVIRQ